MARELSCECGRCDTCEARERKRYSRMRARMTAEELAEEARRKAERPNFFEGLSEMGDALGIVRRPRPERKPDELVQMNIRLKASERERVKALCKREGWTVEHLVRSLVLRFVEGSD